MTVDREEIPWWLSGDKAEAFVSDVESFRDHSIDHDELYNRLTERHGFPPEEAQQFVDVECDISD